MSRLQTLRNNANRWGWMRAIMNVAVKGSARYLGLHIYLVRVRSISSPSTNVATSATLNFRHIENHELMTLCQDPELDMSLLFVEAAKVRGDLAFGAFDGDVLAAYTWRSIKHAPDTADIWIRIKHPYCYSYKAFTRAAYRGQRINPKLFLYADVEMKKLGYKYRVGFVGLTNYASLEMSKHMESEIIGPTAYIIWCGKLFSFRSKAVKKIGLEFFHPTLPK